MGYKELFSKKPVNEATKIVAKYLDCHAYNSYIERIEDFIDNIKSDVEDCGSNIHQEKLIKIALEQVNWRYLHEREYNRMIEDRERADREAARREETGEDKDIPF